MVETDFQDPEALVDEELPAALFLSLARMFEKRLRRCRAMGYELDCSDPSPESAGKEYVIEYQQR